MSKFRLPRRAAAAPFEFRTGIDNYTGNSCIIIYGTGRIAEEVLFALADLL